MAVDDEGLEKIKVAIGGVQQYDQATIMVPANSRRITMWISTLSAPFK